MLEEKLIEAVRLLGVALGLYGTWVLSADAVRAALPVPWRLVKATWARLLIRLGRRRPRPPVHMSGTAKLVLTTTGNITVGLGHWDDDASHADQIAHLRHRTDLLHSRIEHMSKSHRSMVEDLRSEVHGRLTEHDDTTRALSEQLANDRRSNLALNARGVPLLGWSILLSGLPEWMLVSAVSAVLILVGVGLTLGTIFSEQLERFIAKTPPII